MRAESLQALEVLRRRRDELRKQAAALEEDISVLSSIQSTENMPIRAEEFLAEPGDFEWLVGGLIAEGTVSMMAAEPRLGKTTLLVQMALCLSIGQDVLGFRIPRPARVLYVLAEGSRHAFRGRLRTTCESLGVNTSALDWWIQPGGMIDFNLTGSEFSRMLRSSGARLVVLDTLGYFGIKDENDANAWKENVMSPLRAYSTELGCSFVLVHHNRKAGQHDSGNRWERGRGTSAMFGDVDHWLTLDRVPLARHEEQLPAIERSKLEQRRELHVEKNKYGLDDYAVQLEFWKPRGTFEVGSW